MSADYVCQILGLYGHVFFKCTSSKLARLLDTASKFAVF